MKAQYRRWPSLPLVLILGLSVACSGGAESNALGVNPPPPPPPPPVSGSWSPHGTPMCEDDYTSFADWDEFAAGTDCISNVDALGTSPNVSITDGGLTRRYVPMPGSCSDHFAGQPARIPLPETTTEVWIELVHVYSDNWTNANPNCTSPVPAHKALLAWTEEEKDICGVRRFDWVIGATNAFFNHAAAPGYPSCDDAPIFHDGTQGTINSPGGAGAALWDGEPHTFRLHFTIHGDGWFGVYVDIDGVATHDYVTMSDPRYEFIRLITGPNNRNLGAPELMWLWWRELRVWGR